MPVFTILPGSPLPVLYSKDTHPTFVNFWKPICSLDSNIWHRWMHTHRYSFHSCCSSLEYILIGKLFLIDNLLLN